MAPCFHIAVAILVLLFMMDCSQGSDPSGIYCNKNATIDPTGLVAMNRDALLDGIVYGLGQCRADLDTDKCSACIATASATIKGNCSDVSDAQIWYDECTIRYSQNMFFGNFDASDKKVVIPDPKDYPLPASELRSGLARLLKKIKARIASDPTSGGFAKEKLQLTKTNTLYGVAQCTQDLSPEVCGKCLDATKAEFEDNKRCSGKQGCQVFYSSCAFRYASKEFLSPYANKLEKISDKALEKSTRYEAKQMNELSSRKSMMVSSF